MKHAKRRYYRKTAIALSLLLAFFCILFIFLTVWWFGASFPTFEKLASFQEVIPGLSEGISPQGLCGLPDGTGYDFLMSGYIEGKPSRVYLMKEGEKSGDFVTFTENGEAVRSHFGGIVCTEKFAYIASEEKILVASLEEIVHGDGIVELAGSFETGFSENATCCIYQDMLFIAEFYHPPKYKTDPSHAMESVGGMRHTLCYAYALNDVSEYGIADMVPRKVLSVPDETQGILITDDAMFFSCSYGLAPSRLIRCPNILDEEPDKTFDVNGNAVPLYVIDGERALTMPCMSEEICEKGGKLYMLFESYSKKYRYFVRTRISRLVFLPLSEL